MKVKFKSLDDSTEEFWDIDMNDIPNVGEIIRLTNTRSEKARYKIEYREWEVFRTWEEGPKDVFVTMYVHRIS